MQKKLCNLNFEFKLVYELDPCAKVCQPVPRLCKKLFSKKDFSKSPDLVRRPTAAALPAKIAAIWCSCRLPIKNLIPHYNSHFCVSFHFSIDQEAGRGL